MHLTFDRFREDLAEGTEGLAGRPGVRSLLPVVQ
jgi:hypothetical protein